MAPPCLEPGVHALLERPQAVGVRLELAAEVPEFPRKLPKLGRSGRHAVREVPARGINGLEAPRLAHEGCDPRGHALVA